MSRIATDKYRQLWEIAQFSEPVPAPITPRALMRGDTPLVRDPNVKDSPGPPTRWTRTLGHIHLSQLADFRIPVPPQQLRSTAAFLPPPTQLPQQLPQQPQATPRAGRWTPRAKRMLEMPSASPRAWTQRPVVWNADAGRYVLEDDATPRAAAPTAAAAGSPRFRALSDEPPPVDPVYRILPLPLLPKEPVVVAAADFARSMHEGAEYDKPIGSLLPLPYIEPEPSPRPPRGAAWRGAAPPAPPSLPWAGTARASVVGTVLVSRPRPTPRRTRVVEQLRCGHHDDDGPGPLPPLPAPGDPLSRVDEQVLAVALSEPAHAIMMATELRGHTGLSRLGQRPSKPPLA